MQFVTEEKTRQKSVEKYYTTADIVAILTQILPKRIITLEEIELRIKNKSKRLKRLVKLKKAG